MRPELRTSALCYATLWFQLCTFSEIQEHKNLDSRIESLEISLEYINVFFSDRNLSYYISGG